MTKLSGFSVTFEEFSAEEEECESGYIIKDAPFREALYCYEQEVCGSLVEANVHPISLDDPPSWFTNYQESPDQTGKTINVSFHVPKYVTSASRMRLAKLLGAK